MKRLLLALPVAAAACLLAGPTAASAGSSFHHNWGQGQSHSQGSGNSHHQGNNNNNNNNNWYWGGFGQCDLDDFLRGCNFDLNDCRDDDEFSFKKDDCEVFRVKGRDLDKYACNDNNSRFGGYKGFKLKKCNDWNWDRDFDCVEYKPCKPKPPQCHTVPTPAAAWAGMSLVGLLGAGRTLRRSRAN